MRDAIPLVEPVVGGIPPWLVADVPLAIDGGGVSGRRQDVTHRLLPGHQTAGQAGKLHRAVAGADGVAASHQGRAARRALGFGREIEELQSFAGEAVQPGRLCAAQDASAIAAQFTHAEVVDVDIQNVRWAVRRCLLLNRKSSGFIAQPPGVALCL